MLDRRAFLTETGKLLVLSTAAAAAWDALVEGRPEAAPGYTMTDHWWGMVIDIERCIGCGNCVRACKAENHVPLKPGGYDGFGPAAGDASRIKTFFVPKLCNHCAHSPCVQVCPVGATFESPDGVVLVDADYCLGCRYCVQACPYGCRYIDPRTHTADKCSLCYHRITRGLTTACCETCPTGARVLGDLKNPADPIHEFLRTHKVQVLKPQMATGSKTYYNGLDGAVR